MVKKKSVLKETNDEHNNGITNSPFTIYFKEFDFIMYFILAFIIFIVISQISNFSQTLKEDNLCKQWQPASSKEEIAYDDLTKEEWVKCCIQRVQENGVIKECKYIKLK